MSAVDQLQYIDQHYFPSPGDQVVDAWSASVLQDIDQFTIPDMGVFLITDNSIFATISDLVNNYYGIRQLDNSANTILAPPQSHPELLEDPEASAVNSQTVRKKLYSLAVQILVVSNLKISQYAKLVKRWTGVFVCSIQLINEKPGAPYL